MTKILYLSTVGTSCYVFCGLGKLPDNKEEGKKEMTILLTRATGTRQLIGVNQGRLLPSKDTAKLIVIMNESFILNILLLRLK